MVGENRAHQQLTADEAFTAGIAWASAQYDVQRFTELKESLNAAYRERAILVFALARELGGAWVGIDPAEPDWPVLYIETEAGQMSWHFSPSDANLLEEFPHRDGVWDGHTTEEKYARLAALTAVRHA